MSDFVACELFRKNSLFCASGECPDEASIPIDCDGACLERGYINNDHEGTEVIILKPKSCPLCSQCPCAHPATPLRKKAFKDWLKRKKRKDAIVRAERAAKRTGNRYWS